jgi:hypothetical protein
MKQKSISKTLLLLFTATILITMTMTSLAIDIHTDDWIVYDPDEMLAQGLGGRAPDHHKVLGEQGTATWCVHCPSMGYWLSFVQGDFVYVALVSDMNGYASQRCSQLGLTGYPTTFFDGGYTSVIGHQYSVTNVQNAYNTCQARTVNDLTISVAAALDEDTDDLEVITFIDNNEGSEFNGQLRVFVAEKTSRWDDYDGDPYVNAFLGWAPNTGVSIPAMGTTSVSGSLNYPDMTVDNTLIVAALYDAGNDYVQQCSTTTPVSGGDNGGGAILIPPVLTIVNPTESEILSGTVEITGSAHHPDGDGNLKWTLVKIDDQDWENADGTSDWSYTWDTTSVEDGVHYIRAVTSDGTRQSGIDKIEVLVSNYNFAPETPSMPIGPNEAFAGELLTFTIGTTDPDGDDIKYGIDWDGDDVVDEWTELYPSGETIEVSHIFDTEGTFNVQVKAKDLFEEESGFSPIAEVLIFGENTAPSVAIIKPTAGVYMNNDVLFSFPRTIIIGAIDVIAEASDAESEIDMVEMYVDNRLYDDIYSEPFEFSEVSLDFGRHVIKVVAYDMAGLSSEAEISVFKLF